MSQKIIICRRCHRRMPHKGRGLCSACLTMIHRRLSPSERDARFPCGVLVRIEHGVCYHPTRRMWCAWGITRPWGSTLDKPEQAWILGFCPTQAEAERIAADWRRAVDRRLGIQGAGGAG